MRAGAIATTRSPIPANAALSAACSPDRNPLFRGVTLSCSIRQSRLQGADVLFNVPATGDSLTSQWQCDGVDIPGATAAAFTLTNAQPPDSGNYVVVLSNVLGPVTSDSATLTVRPPPGSPRIEDFAQVSGIGISFLPNGEAGYLYAIEGSTNLTDWRVLTHLTNDTGILQVVRPDDLGQPMQFYRVRWSPQSASRSVPILLPFLYGHPARSLLAATKLRERPERRSPPRRVSKLQWPSCRVGDRRSARRALTSPGPAHFVRIAKDSGWAPASHKSSASTCRSVIISSE
jgi:hypothetical protein